ncbi:Kinesin 3 isoform 1 [Dorcoceras hygrometricum]|uniref:Kinesin 3 isoform 1 n=1 Tax=Dorcoceras hygrometricum TaxID=472368 RepID=A0A2Z7CBR8_9LAMI|nr:Kinesin 3 isoform 1 [Dorcoceras hygrometricum]
MSKAEMLRALKEKKADLERASLSLSKGKRKKTNETSYEYLDASNISFVAKPSGSVSLDFTHRLISDKDYDLVNSVPDLAALESASLHFMQALVWSGSVANRLIRAWEEITKTKHSMDEMLEIHEGLMKQLTEIRANNDKEKDKMVLELEASRAEAQSSKAEALLVEEKNKALQAEVERWKSEAKNSWVIGKEKFLQSKEFKVLCSGKALDFFEKGFDGCLAQFKESGYTEEEHPAPFLDVERALEAMSDDEDAEESNFSREEAPPA